MDTVETQLKDKSCVRDFFLLNIQNCRNRFDRTVDRFDRTVDRFDRTVDLVDRTVDLVRGCMGRDCL